jgi:hypothetical protein
VLPSLRGVSSRGSGAGMPGCCLDGGRRFTASPLPHPPRVLTVSGYEIVVVTHPRGSCESFESRVMSRIALYLIHIYALKHEQPAHKSYCAT